MLPGPVFTFEMMTTARRGRFYSIRALYAIVLLLILWMIHSAWSAESAGELPIPMMPWFGLSAFGALVAGQEILVLVLTPALVAGAIADEKRRKTLHYLLASQLTGPEIVLGKLMVRMLYVAVLLGVSYPVMSLLVLLGGVDPTLVLVCCGALLSTAWLLATLSIWVSTLARRPREALFVTFGLELLWLIVPPILRNGVSTGWSSIDDAVWWLNDWVGASSPVYACTGMFRSLTAGVARDFEQALLWMIGLQAGLGVLLALSAAIQLRPVFKRQDGAVLRPRGLRALLLARRLRRHRPLGDRPMLWKELHTGGARGFARIVAWVLTLVLGGLLLYYSAWFGLEAFLEVREYGYGAGWAGWLAHRGRMQFLYFLKMVVPLVYLMWILVIAGAAAASLTSEHEDDTWTSLTATDLTGREIVLAKLFGSLWRARRLSSVTALLLIAGVAAGSLHFLSLPAVALAMAVYGWFSAALGVWISIQLRSTWRAQFLTIAMLLLINVLGQGLINMLAEHGYAPLVWPGFTPYEIAKLVAEPPSLGGFQVGIWPRFWRLWEVDDSPGWLATFSIMSLVGYASLASVLTWQALQRFEPVAGRARRKRAGARSPSGGPELVPLANAQPT